MLLWRHIAACDCAWTKRPTVIGFVRTTRVTNVLVFQQVYLMLGPEMNSIFLVAPLTIFAANYLTDIEPSALRIVNEMISNTSLYTC